jgi:hypothetical protein
MVDLVPEAVFLGSLTIEAAPWPPTFSLSPRLSTTECSGEIPDLEFDLDVIGAQQPDDFFHGS